MSVIKICEVLNMGLRNTFNLLKIQNVQYRLLVLLSLICNGTRQIKFALVLWNQKGK